MAWTTPRDWVTLETVTAALMNAQLRDNLKALTSPTTASVTLLGASSNPSGYTGTCAYMHAGSRVYLEVEFTMGSGWSAGGGAYSFQLPVAASGRRIVGSGAIRDSSANQSWPLWIELTDANTAFFRGQPSSAGSQFINVTGTNPLTLANGDSLTATIEYWAA